MLVRVYLRSVASVIPHVLVHYIYIYIFIFPRDLVSSTSCYVFFFPFFSLKLWPDDLSLSLSPYYSLSFHFSLSRKYHNAHLYRTHRYRLVLVRIRGKYACIPETCVHERVNEREKNFFVDRVTREKLFFLFPLSFSFRSFFPLLLRISLLSTFKLTRTLLLEGLSYGVSCELTDLGDQF